MKCYNSFKRLTLGLFACMSVSLFLFSCSRGHDQSGGKSPVNILKNEDFLRAGEVLNKARDLADRFTLSVEAGNADKETYGKCAALLEDALYICYELRDEYESGEQAIVLGDMIREILQELRNLMNASPFDRRECII